MVCSDREEEQFAIAHTSTPAGQGSQGAALALPETIRSILEFSRQDDAPNYRIYLTNDKLVYGEIQDIPKRFPDIDLEHCIWAVQKYSKKYWLPWVCSKEYR